MNDVDPGETQIATFTVKNTGTIELENYQVCFSKVINTFINDEVVYTLSVTFIETGSLQNYNQVKNISFLITINQMKEFGTLIARQGNNSTELFWEYREILQK